MRLIKQLVAVTVVAVIGSRTVLAVEDDPWLRLVSGIVTAVLTVVTYAWVVRRTEDRPPTEVASTTAATGLIGGALIGCAMCASVIATLALLGSYRVTGVGSVTGALGLLGFMAAAATVEEVLFRGVLFRVVEERLGSWVALVLTGGVFGLMHLSNPDASVWGAIAVAIAGGFMLAACYAATRTLWVPIGLHFGWNFALGGVAGAVVSGNGSSASVLTATFSGGNLVTGGDFGPEASIFTIAAGVALTLIFLRLAQRRGNLVGRPRRRAANAEPDATHDAKHDAEPSATLLR